ncbi:hypothetical protein [Sphaerisporangium aureirubrum]|uniref:Sodium:proton antiporter n=1 Tax=Sphaerisporangium aureirubrum TaxID=1544736 RepID=A0ABW1NSX2_9ACTN
MTTPHAGVFTERGRPMKEDWKQSEGWLQQDNLIYLGLIGLGIVLVQPFLTVESLDTSAMVCVLAFSISIPLMAFLIMINQLQTQHRHTTYSNYLALTKTVAVLSACAGVVAAFWHITWLAGVVVSVAATLGLGIYSAHYIRIERDVQARSAE